MVRRQLNYGPLPIRNPREIALMLMRRRRRLRVRGDSMLPYLSDGDIVLVDDRAYQNRLPAVGHIVVAKHPYQRDYYMIKRVTQITKSGAYFLRGDNPEGSTDSSSFGALRYDKIVARVTSRL